MIRIIKIILILSVCSFFSCNNDEEQQSIIQPQPIQNKSLIEVLKTMGFTIQNNGIVENEKFINTKYLNLSNGKIKSLKGLEIFKNLEVLNLEGNAIESINLSNFPKLKVLNLAKNPNLKKIEGLKGYKTSLLEELILPFHLRHEFGELPLFVKERSNINPQFSAKIEKNIYGDELRDYNYYYIFKNVNVSNYIFRFLGEDNFLIVEQKGKKIEALDMSKKVKAIPNKEYNLQIKADKVVSYEDVEILINKGLKFSNFPLKSFEITTEEATYIESLDILDFSGYEELESVKIDQMPIKEVFFKGCKKLKSVEIGNSNLIDSAVPKKPQLVTVSLEDSPLLEALNLNAMPSLTTLKLNQKAPLKKLHLTKLGISDIQNLNTSYIETIHFSNINLNKIDIKSKVLKNVKVIETNIQNLDFSMAKKLDGDIIIGENRELKKITFPTTTNQICNKVQIYRNKVKRIDLTMYSRIDVLATVVWTGKVYKEKEGVKGTEEGLEELLINTDAIVSNLPQSPGKDWDGSNKPSMKIYVDVDFLKKSNNMKEVYEKGGKDKTKPYIKLYKYGYKYGEYRNIGVVKEDDFK